MVRCVPPSPGAKAILNKLIPNIVILEYAECLKEKNIYTAESDCLQEDAPFRPID